MYKEYFGKIVYAIVDQAMVSCILTDEWENDDGSYKYYVRPTAGKGGFWIEKILIDKDIQF